MFFYLEEQFQDEKRQKEDSHDDQVVGDVGGPSARRVGLDLSNFGDVEIVERNSPDHDGRNSHAENPDACSKSRSGH